jgi:BirA family biotin operon repressor/biotin-[acetyl-CoA-carboxylase] ligase
LRPPVPPARLGWLPLLAGVALVQAVGRIAVVDAVLKWPNDLLVRSAAAPADYGKCAGILAEAVTGGAASDGATSDGAASGGAASGATAVVLGIGLNVTQAADELPGGRANLPATSLALTGAASTDRDPLLRGVLRTFADWYGRWVEAAGDPEAAGLAAAYRESCFTLGRQVAVSLPAGEVLEGTAVAIDDDGQLVVSTDQGDRPVAAGDVEHVR